jgi:formyltetrahydrofolate synthetase
MAAESTTSSRTSRTLLLASMRPRPNGRGKAATISVGVMGAPRFNEAAAKWPRKGPEVDEGRSAVGASMRPRPNGRGKTPQRIRKQKWVLQ